jgi:ribose transport system permease protein
VLLIAAYLAATTKYFLTGINITNIFVQSAELAIVAFGVTLAVIAAELDLSVGAGVALVSVTGALVSNSTGSIALGLLVGAATGLALGVVNGVVVTCLQVPSFMATFGTLTICYGLALSLSGGGIVYINHPSVTNLTETKLIGIPVIVITMFTVLIVLSFVQNHTSLGVRLFAVGGNREAARLSGIRVNYIRFWCFVITGLTAAVAGLTVMSRLQSGQPQEGQLLPLEAIAAIVIGGTSLFGGRGSVVKTFWGVMLITTIANGLDLRGVTYNTQQVIIGCVFIAGASVDFFRRWLRRYRKAVRSARLGEGASVSPAPSQTQGSDAQSRAS